MSKNENTMSAYAVFATLYNAKKTTIMDILRETVKDFLSSNSLIHMYSISDFGIKYNNYFGFEIPLAVLELVLTKMPSGVSIKENSVVITEKFRNDKGERFNYYKENLESLKKELINYACKTNSDFSKEFQDKIVSDFFLYMDDSLDLIENEKINTIAIISSFITKSEIQTRYLELLELIQQGHIIYTGFTADIDKQKFSQIDKRNWKNPLTIYLDTEILFDLNGYNGPFLEQVALDFIKLIKDFNMVNKNLISIKYFADVDKEVNDYFYAAEQIVGKNANQVITKEAMKFIVNGCKNPSDVKRKKYIYDKNLLSYGIELDDYDKYYDEENFRYNIENSETEVHPYINFINILRKGHNNERFQNAKFLLVTRTREILKNYGNNLDSKELPKAFNLFYIIERLWFILGKGFGQNETLKSFDTLFRSRMILSDELSKKIKTEYDEINIKVKSGEFSKDEAAHATASIMYDYKRLTEVINTDSDEIVSFLHSYDVDKAIQDIDIMKSTIKSTTTEVENLKKENDIQSNTITQQEKELEDLRKYKEQKEQEENEKKSKELKKQKMKKRLILWIRYVIVPIIIIFTQGVLRSSLKEGFKFNFKYWLDHNLINYCFQGILGEIVNIVVGIIQYCKRDNISDV